MRHWFGGIATTCRTATAYEESHDIAQPARFSQQPPALPLSGVGADSLLLGFVKAQSPGGCG